MSNRFAFSQAAYPAEELNVSFSNGYRKTVFTDSLTQQDIPMLAVSVSKEHVFDIFLLTSSYPFLPLSKSIITSLNFSLLPP